MMLELYWHLKVSDTVVSVWNNLPGNMHDAKTSDILNVN